MPLLTSWTPLKLNSKPPLLTMKLKSKEKEDGAVIKLLASVLKLTPLKMTWPATPLNKLTWTKNKVKSPTTWTTNNKLLLKTNLTWMLPTKLWRKKTKVTLNLPRTTLMLSLPVNKVSNSCLPWDPTPPVSSNLELDSPALLPSSKSTSPTRPPLSFNPSWTSWPNWPPPPPILIKTSSLRLSPLLNNY